jgi:tetratricopeptide (TPR) repeat protein
MFLLENFMWMGKDVWKLPVVILMCLTTNTVVGHSLQYMGLMTEKATSHGTETDMSSQQWRDSLSSLSRLIERYPRSTDLRLKKAAVNIELGQWDFAVEEYGHVLRLDDKNLAALYYRAYAQVHQRRYTLARNDYESFLRLQPMNMEARLGLAMVNEKLGRKTEALDNYNDLVQMFPDSAVCFAARASYETTLKQYEVALFDWDEAIRCAPQNVDYIVTKISLLLQMKRHADAREEIEKALRRGVPRGVLKEWIDRCRTATR